MRELKFRVWDGEQMVLPDYIDCYGRNWWVANHIPTDKKILMQYTGLKDKNGKEIYEGDLVENDNHVLFEIVWLPIGMFVQVRVSDKNEIYDMRWNGKKIIGNIYENHDLTREK